MMKIKKSKLPEFLKKSPILDNFVDENGYIEVPKKNYVKNLEVNNTKEYINLLHTVSFFNVEIPNEIMEFENNPDNENQILEILLNNKDDPFIKGVLDNFKILIINRSQIVNFFIDIGPHNIMEKLDEDDELSKNPHLNVGFNFKK